MGREQHRFHGDPKRFDVVADFIAARYKGRVRYVADVAGGQGMLCRILEKRYQFDAEVIDPRGWFLKGVSARGEVYRAAMSQYFDLVIGLHPDQATREVAESALFRPVVLVPCCNFWSQAKLGTSALIGAISSFYQAHRVSFESVELGFSGPYNTALVSEPPA